jgi:hypothetical protein
MFPRFLILKFLTSSVHSYPASQRNVGLSCCDKIQNITAVLFSGTQLPQLQMASNMDNNVTLTIILFLICIFNFI